MGEERLVIELCAEHSSAFDRDLGMWARLSGEDAPEVRQGQFAVTRERQIERAAEVVTQVKERFRPLASPDPKVVTVAKLPAKFHTWQLSKHAVERCVERGVSQRDALLAAADPALAYTDPVTGQWVHQRGDLYCYVNRESNTVITLVTGDMREAKRLQKEAANG